MTANIRILLLSSEYPPHIFGGLGTHVDQITASLSDSVSFELFVPKWGNFRNGNPSIHIREVPIPYAQTNIEFWLHFCQNAVSAARNSSNSIDLIHCHDWMTVLAGIKLRELLGIPLIYNVHLPQTAGPSLAIENIGLIGADLVIVNSRAVRTELETRNLKIRRLKVVPNGVDIASYNPTPNWPADDGYILFVGRLVPQKGVDLLIRAFRVLLQRCPGTRLVIAGDGEQELYLQRTAHYLGISHRVKFVNWQSGDTLADYYKRAQVVVVPSYYEPFGIVALEAMACGRPIIASRVGGLEEFIEDGVQGFLAPVGDYLQLAQRLAYLVLNQEIREKMGKAARTRALCFAWKNIGEDILSLYQNMMAEPSDPGQPDIINLESGFLTALTPSLAPAALTLLNMS
jgi:glycosyltransferase involved in cell wall biosynthesis